MQHDKVWQTCTGVSKERAASIFRVENELEATQISKPFVQLVLF
jgi:hypothetical protein